MSTIINEQLICIKQIINYDISEGISADVLIDIIKGLKQSGDKVATLLKSTSSGKAKCHQICFTEIKENCIKIDSIFKFVLSEGCLKYLDKALETANKNWKNMTPDERKELLKKELCRFLGIVVAFAGIAFTVIILKGNRVTADNGSLVITGDHNTVNESNQKSLDQINEQLKEMPEEVAGRVANIIQREMNSERKRLKETAVKLLRPGGIMPHSVSVSSESNDVPVVEIGSELLSQIPEYYEDNEIKDQELILDNVMLKLTKADDTNGSKSSWACTVTSDNRAEQAFLSDKRLGVEIPQHLIDKVRYREEQRVRVKLIYRTIKGAIKPRHYVLEEIISEK